MTKRQIPKIGDWVRFMDGNRPVIGSVLYVQIVSLRPATVLVTDAGRVNNEDVLEVRSMPPTPSFSACVEFVEAKAEKSEGCNG